MTCTLKTAKIIRGGISPCNIAGLISKHLRRSSHLDRQKSASLTTPVIWCPHPEEPLWTSANAYFQKLESLAYIFAVIVWVLSSFIFCSALQMAHLFCNRVHISHLKSSKVDDFGTNRKHVCDFLLVIIVTMVLSCTVSEIWWLM